MVSIGIKFLYFNDYLVRQKINTINFASSSNLLNNHGKSCQNEASNIPHCILWTNTKYKPYSCLSSNNTQPNSIQRHVHKYGHHTIEM